MPLVIDSSRSFRSPLEVTGLIQAIVGASPNDESDWVEWKNGALMLGQKSAYFSIARHTLGMANRLPEGAALHAEGCGYIVVGAEPGQCQGVTEVDPADLDAGIRPYLGSDGPRWSAQYVKSQPHGGSVLVVTVEPPRRGDPPFTLRKEYDKYLAGAIFVRRPGRTDRPGRATFRVLQTGTPQLTARSHCMSGQPGLTIHCPFLWTVTTLRALKHGRVRQGKGCASRHPVARAKPSTYLRNTKQG